MVRGNRKDLPEAVAEATRRRAKAPRRGGRPSDVLGGELRRRDVFEALVLQLIEREPTYGNRLIERISEITDGAVAMNPNTMYPLLRELEERGLIEGSWEHPDKRTRRFYSATAAGRRERERLVGELEPFLDRMITSLSLIKHELFEDA